MAVAAGTLLDDRYRVVRRLGAGGMASVYLAQDERLERLVAVKRMHAESPEEMARRVLREAKLGAALNHPNLVGVFDTAADDEGVLIVMEYVEGETLAQALKRERLDGARALTVIREVAAALDHVHAHGVVHRDVKPANVLLAREGGVKLSDLGIARATEGTKITATGIVLGSPTYMAPEQIEGRAVGPAADVYGLAAVAFEALSGRRAREGTGAVDSARRAVDEPPPDLRDAWPGAPPVAAEVLSRGMCRDPGGRPATAGRLAAELEAAVEGRALEPPAPARAAAAGRAFTSAQTTPARPTAGTTHRGSRLPRRALPVLALVLFLAAAVGVLAASVGGGDDPRPDAGDTTANPPPSEPDPPAPEAPAEPTTNPPETDPAPAPAEGLGPDETVAAFYERAAADDFEGAWALAGEGVRAQLGGYEGFVSTLSSLESIEFTPSGSSEEDGTTASVDFTTAATHPDRVDRCTGSAGLTRAGAGWLIDRLRASCSAGPRPASGTPAPEGDEGDDE